jgi:hypothetical protein
MSAGASTGARSSACLRVLASLVVTTQWTADALGYQSQLGRPMERPLRYPSLCAMEILPVVVLV